MTKKIKPEFLSASFGCTKHVWIFLKISVSNEADAICELKVSWGLSSQSQYQGFRLQLYFVRGRAGAATNSTK